MEIEIKNLYKNFKRISEKGWIKSVNKGDSGVGCTFETFLGIANNDLEIPDYNGIEIKTQRKKSRSYITLFSCKPEGRYYHEVQRIKDMYGYPHKTLTRYKVLNNSVYCNVKNKIGNKFYFKLEVSRCERKVYLLIYDLRGNLLEREVYWDFEILEEKINRKLKLLALIKAYSRKSNIDGYEYFKYYSFNVYHLKNFEKFIKLLEIGVIRVNFKLNIKTKGDKLGQIHDHGTSFDILEKDISKLYDRCNIN